MTIALIAVVAIAIALSSSEAVAAPRRGTHRVKINITGAIYTITAVSGTVQASFASDPATCAAVGRCGISGSETFTAGKSPQQGALLFEARIGKAPPDINGEIMIGGNSTAAVGGSGLATPCSDSIASVALALAFVRASGSNVGVVLPSLDPRQQSISQTLVIGGGDPFDLRCAGPRLLDVLRPAMTPIQSMPLSAIRRRHLQLGLTQAKPFNSGGFAGTLTTDLHIALKKLRLPKGVSGSFSGTLTGPGGGG